MSVFFTNSSSSQSSRDRLAYIKSTLDVQAPEFLDNENCEEVTKDQYDYRKDRTSKMTSLFGQKVFCCAIVLVMACFSENVKMLLQKGTINQTILLYLHSLAVSSWIGIQAWVIFVAGITMYFNMPRHVFGHIQSKLWPLYFRIGTSLTIIALLTNGAVLQLREKKTRIEEFQHISGLLVSLLCGVLNSFYFEPNATRLWMDRFAFEKERGFGNEIGPIKNKELLANPKYKALTHKFAMFHGMSSLATVFSFIGGLVYLWYLTCHLINT